MCMCMCFVCVYIYTPADAQMEERATIHFHCRRTKFVSRSEPTLCAITTCTIYIRNTLNPISAETHPIEKKKPKATRRAPQDALCAPHTLRVMAQLLADICLHRSYTVGRKSEGLCVEIAPLPAPTPPSSPRRLRFTQFKAQLGAQ